MFPFDDVIMVRLHACAQHLTIKQNLTELDQVWLSSNKANISTHEKYVRLDTSKLKMIYRKITNIRRTKSQNLNASRLIL